MSSREFARWIAYDRINPIGQERMDAYVMLLYGIINNSHISDKDDAIDVSDIADRLWKNRRQTSDEDAYEEVYQQFAHLGITPEGG